MMYDEEETPRSPARAIHDLQDAVLEMGKAIQSMNHRVTKVENIEREYNYPVIGLLAAIFLVLCLIAWFLYILAGHVQALG